MRVSAAIGRAAALLGAAATWMGCSGGEDVTELGLVLEGVPSFEEYRDAAPFRLVNGERVYQIEFDLFLSEEGLYEHYVSRIEEQAETTDKAVVIRQLSTSTDLTFARGVDALTVTYCVSNTFGANQAQAIQDMANATADWQRAANFRFIYDASKNGNCVGGAAGIDVAVIPDISGGACATPPYFPPSQQFAWCSGFAQGTLAFDYAGYPWGFTFPNLTTRGVMRHELGHILGLRHEHAFAPTPPPGCGEGQNIGTDIGGRPLTTYDSDSVMHYPQCGNSLTSWELTPRDAEGVRALYGMPAAWYPAFALPIR